jgi:fructose-1,6-bisphosphatase II
MDKIIVGPTAAGKINLSWPVAANLHAIALSLDRDISNLTVAILDRERHLGLIEEVRKAGARVKLIGDGDVIAALSAAIRGTNVHAVFGIGGAPEGVLAAAALKCLGGEIQGRFVARNSSDLERLKSMGVDPDRVYKTNELAPGGSLVFCATGITDGDILKGVRFFKNGARCHTISMAYRTQVVRFSDSVHLMGDGARVWVQI